MLEIYDRNRVKQAVLQNALGITETLKINAIYTLRFSLPYDDPKNEFCRPYWFVKFNHKLYRILPSALEISDTGTITYECEHVLATLLDKSMFGYYHIGGIGVFTGQVIQWLLSLQNDWRLGVCEFARQFEYGWEQETVLSALLSIPTRFTEPYIWTYDTDTYPWTVNLKRLDVNALPRLYIRNEKNMLTLSKKSDPRQICTRLYPLGYGEGINQLNIRNVNGGVPYLQSPPPYIEQYGVIERIWIDRRYEDPESLKEAAQAMLDELQNPYEEYSVSFAELDSGYFDKAEIGKIVQITDQRAGIKKKSYVTEITRDYDDVINSTLTVANKPRDIASSIAELADRQRIEAAYSQGATQLYSQALQADADTAGGAVLDFFIPAEMRIVNKVLAKVRMESFRAYSKATEGGGAITRTSSSGGGRSSTTASGGGKVTTTGQSGGKTVLEETSLPSSTTTAGLKKHVHNFWLVKHEHNVSIPSHTHRYDVPEHVHDISLPNHIHEIRPGIYRFGNPRSFSIYVNGALKTVVNATETEIDLTPFLVDQNGTIPRGSWQAVEVRPDDLAYITVVLFVQGFIQSRGDNTV